MMVDVQDLVERLKDLKGRLQELLNEDDDFTLAITLAVLESLDEEVKE